MILTFTSYEVVDEPYLAIRFHFVCDDPGPGQPNDYYVTLSQSDIDGVTTALQLRNILEARLRRRLQADTIAAKLDPFIGTNITI